MGEIRDVDWTQLDAGARRALVQRLKPHEAAAAARSFAWGRHPIDVLGAITARPDCTLGTALTVFIRSDPERFEAIDAVLSPLERREFQLLLRLHATINAGAHRYDPRDLPDEPERIARLVVPRSDRSPGRAVWGFDPLVVGPVLDQVRSPLRQAVRVADALRAGATPQPSRRNGAFGIVLGRLSGVWRQA